MFGQETSEEIAAKLLYSYQQALNNLPQKMLIKDVRVDKFHGWDNEDISGEERTPKKVETKKSKTNNCRLLLDAKLDLNLSKSLAMVESRQWWENVEVLSQRCSYISPNVFSGLNGCLYVGSSVK